MSNTTSLVRHEHDEKTGIHRIILDRPKARNAISRQLLQELDYCLDKVQIACAAPSPALEVLAWKQTQRRQEQERERHQNNNKPIQGMNGIATLDWPSPPISRRSSTIDGAMNNLSMRSTSSSTRSSSPSSSADQNDPTFSPISSSNSSLAPPTQPARCLILCSSSDKAFCAGADLAERRTMSQEEVIEYLSKLRIVMDKLQNMPVPTIAAIDGPALGGGLELALCCDFRIAALARQDSETSSLKPLLGFPECQLGIIPGAGGTQRAARLLGVSRAKSLVFTGKLLNAEEAHSWGLVEFVCDSSSQTAVERALELAQKMQNSAPLALSAAKAAIDVGEEMDLQPGLDWEAACYHALLPTQDRREALTAFAEKRKPQFQGR